MGPPPRQSAAMLTLLAPLLLAAAAAPAPPTPAEIVAAAPASAWRTVKPENIVVFESPVGRLVVELAPQFAPAHAEAVRALVRARRFDGGAIVRVQENYVVQWAARPEGGAPLVSQPPDQRGPRQRPRLPAEYERDARGLTFTPLPYKDVYAEAGFVDGFPAARDAREGKAWLAQCPGMVGAGRDMPPDTGDGSELYAVTGHAPRHLDRNTTALGRVLAGLDGWDGLKRGSGDLGFYPNDSERTAVTSAHMASEMTGFGSWQVMDTTSASFAAYVKARANRTGFFVRQAGATDLCNVQVPVRSVPTRAK